MSYIEALRQQREQPDAWGAGIIGLGKVAGGLAEWSVQEEKRKRDEAERRLEYVNKRGGLAAGRQAWEAAAGYANQVPALEKAAGLGDGSGAPIVGSPYSATAGNFGPGDIPMPKGLMGGIAGNDFSNPQSQAAISSRLGYAPELEQMDPYKAWVQKGTANIVRPADANPYKKTVDDWREGYKAAEDRARLMGGFGLERTRMTTTTSAANTAANNATRTNIADNGNANHLDVAGLNIGGRLAVANVNNTAKAEENARKAAAARAAAEKKMKDKRAAEASQASFVMARIIGKGVAGVNVAAIGEGGEIRLNLPRSANGGEDQTAARAVAAMARTHGYKFTPGANGQPAALRPFSGAHAASLRQSLADPKMVWNRQGGIETRVEDKPGVRREAPPPKPAAAKPPRVWTTADEAKVDAEFGRQWESRHPRAMGGYRGDPKDRAEEEQTMRETIMARYKAAPEFGGAAAPEDPGAELLRKVRERDAARKKKKGGK